MDGCGLDVRRGGCVVFSWTLACGHAISKCVAFLHLRKPGRFGRAGPGHEQNALADMRDCEAIAAKDETHVLNARRYVDTRRGKFPAHEHAQ